MLKTKHGYTNLINLEGGMQAWRERVDPEIVVM
jgi:rhodanese-related sulfurtransferase